MIKTCLLCKVMFAIGINLGSSALSAQAAEAPEADNDATQNIEKIFIIGLTRY